MCSSGSDREASGESLLFQSLLFFFYLIDLPTLHAIRSYELLFMPYAPFIKKNIVSPNCVQNIFCWDIDLFKGYESQFWYRIKPYLDWFWSKIVTGDIWSGTGPFLAVRHSIPIPCSQIFDKVKFSILKW